MMLQAGHPCASEREYLPVMLVSTLSLLLLIAIDLVSGGVRLDVHHTFAESAICFP